MDTGEKPISARTRATRTRIISAAEDLFAERGVASVSLNEITRAAEQKNRNAVHYHFGSKDALLRAIFEKHRAPISVQRRQMIEAIRQRGNTQLRDIAAVLVRPVAARFADPDGGMAYIKISAQLAAANMLDFMQRENDAAEHPGYGTDMRALWAPFLKHIPPALVDQRLSLIVGMLFHGLADHTIFRSATDGALADTELMVSNLIDSLCAVLTAPVSGETQAALEGITPP